MAIRIKHEDGFLVISDRNYDPKIHELYEAPKDVKEEKKARKPTKKDEGMVDINKDNKDDNAINSRK